MVDRTEDRNKSVQVGYEYPKFQLTKALINENNTGTQESIQKREKWEQVLESIFSGQLNVGSRTPIAETPSWITLEVLTGGFATGNFMAGGELQDYEIELCQSLSIPINEVSRTLLNGYFLSEQGINDLGVALESGEYQIGVPEEGAILTIAWLLANNDAKAAQIILSEITPFFDRLRFYPKITKTYQANGNEVFLQSIGETQSILQKIEPNVRITKQENTIRVWMPFYEKLIRLLLDTIDGENPSIETCSSGKPISTKTGGYAVVGGMPFSIVTEDWTARAASLLKVYDEIVVKHPLSNRLKRKGSQFSMLTSILKQSALNVQEIENKDKNYVRLALARYILKHGAPGTERAKEYSIKQNQQCVGPRHYDIAKIMLSRVSPLLKDHGLPDVAMASLHVTEEESSDFDVPKGTKIPDYLIRKVSRAQVATPEELVQLGIIKSADMLAIILPQVTAGVRASGISDFKLRRLYNQIYRAFRRRRSLLLLNLESQVKLEELPWVSSIGSYRKTTIKNKELAKTVLTDIAILAISKFPYAILPNKLLQELRSLIEQAELKIPIVDEIAADIFMGKFSEKFALAAHLAGEELAGSIYEKYYGIKYDLLVQNPLLGKPQIGAKQAKTLTSYCYSMAVSGSRQSWSVAENGVVIEQQQIATTQNLAILFGALALKDRLKPELIDMAKWCFKWISQYQQVHIENYHARLIMMKNTAYAWRQMLFFLSYITHDELLEFTKWLNSHFYQQESEFVERFKPAVIGLNNVIHGADITKLGGLRFLAWSVGRHPLFGVS